MVATLEQERYWGLMTAIPLEILHGLQWIFISPSLFALSILAGFRTMAVLGELLVSVLAQESFHQLMACNPHRELEQFVVEPFELYLHGCSREHPVDGGGHYPATLNRELTSSS